MSRINRVPWGLQNFLGSKNFGVNPAELRQDVQPVVDMAQFYNYELLRTDGVLGTFTGTGQEITLTIPEGEAWSVYSLHGDLQAVGATEKFYCVIEVRPKNADTTSFAYLASLTKDTDTNASGYGLTALLPQPLLFGPGTEFRLRAIAGNISAISAGLVAMYARYEI